MFPSALKISVQFFPLKDISYYFFTQCTKVLEIYTTLSKRNLLYKGTSGSVMIWEFQPWHSLTSPILLSSNLIFGQ